MRKLIASVVIAGLSSFAYAQDEAVNGEQKTNARAREYSRTHEASENQVPRQSRELRSDLHGRADVNVRDRDSTNTNVNVQDQNRTRTDINVQGRERNRADVNVREHTTTSRHEERAENRGGKFFFRDREIHRHPGYDHSDWHFRIGRHDRLWYYEHYQTVVFVDGCWYYEDGGLLWPAYGFDPSCDYPDQFIVFQFNG